MKTSQNIFIVYLKLTKNFLKLDSENVIELLFLLRNEVRFLESYITKLRCTNIKGKAMFLIIF